MPRNPITLLMVVLSHMLVRMSAASDILGEAYASTLTSSFLVKTEQVYFSQDLDVIGYLDSLEGSSRPEKYSQSAFSLAYKFEAWRPFVEFREVSGSVERSTQPLVVESAADYLTLGLAYSVGTEDRGGSAVFKLTNAKQADVTIDCYERSGVVLGGDCEEADFQLIDGDLLLETGEISAFPVLTSSAEAISAELSLNAWYRPYGWGLDGTWSLLPLLLGHSLKFTGSEMKHDNYSPLYDLQSSFLLNTPFNGKTLRTLIAELQDDLPQQSPWQDAVIRYDFSASYFVDDWIVSGSLGGLYVKRFSYSDSLQRKEYNSNFMVIGEIWYQFQDAAVYLKGEAFSNYLLGVDALAYTNKSSRFFKHPYGQVTLGFVMGL